MSDSHNPAARQMADRSMAGRARAVRAARAICASALLLLCGTAHAAGVFTYTTYKDESGEAAVEITRRIEPLKDDHTRVTIHWAALDGSSNGRQRYVLDPDYATVQWENESTEGIDYVGTREGNVLHIRGTHLGEPVDKKLEIDDRPFHFNPSVGLQRFALSGEDRIEFWTLRPDNFSKYTMKADRQGLEAIEANGKRVQAVRVKWGLTGIQALFFSQTLWFRVSDGVLVRAGPLRGERIELVREQPLP